MPRTMSTQKFPSVLMVRRAIARITTMATAIPMAALRN